MSSMTKQELIELNAELTLKLSNMKDVDQLVRKDLSKLLDSYEFNDDDYRFGSGRKKELVIASWLEIAFMIGELKADANYSCVIEARETLKNDNQRLLDSIHELQNPEPTP